MNGIHDMGGMHGMGPVPYEKDEPVFHEQWEARVYAIHRALGAYGLWNIDSGRHVLELYQPDEYLRMSYYERWGERLFIHALRFGLVTAEEMATGRPDPAAPKRTPALTAADEHRFLDRALPDSNDPSRPARFALGERVRARNFQPLGHTRLPRYLRGHVGEIVRDHGVHIFPDTNAHFQGEKRQHLYAVRFTAREVWGPQAPPRDTIHADLFEDYLEPLHA